MTVPFERYRAIDYTRIFLESLLDPKETPRVPKTVRDRARWALRHYPTFYELEAMTEKCPDYLAKNF